MCRIFCSPDKEQTFVKRDLWQFFEVLEKALGKDGNGVYNLTTKGLWKSHKRMPKEADIKGGLLFHTRFATDGLVKDYNCQPFDNERYVFVHNGVFRGIESYARLLGFHHQPKKYSDSYMMAYIMEKVGILNFYNAFKSKSYGVIVVYDKKVDKIYLLKTSGSFEYGILKNGSYIYGSSKLEYWQIQDEAEEFEKGLWIISKDGFIQLDKIESAYTSTYFNYYNTDRSLIYDYKTRSYIKRETIKEKKRKKRNKQIKDKFGEKFCVYCSEKLEKEHVYSHYGNKICETCNTQYVDKNGEGQDLPEEYPLGIGALFAQIIPIECYGCRWIYEQKCWFGGVEHDKPVNVSNPDTKKLICNTKTSPLDLMINCEICRKRLSKDDEWGIIKELITCKDCEEYEEKWYKSCDKCEHYTESSITEPCCSCWDHKGVPRNWESKVSKSTNRCNNCYYEKTAGPDYPCKICRDTSDGLSEWTAKNGILSINPRCAICGYYFETWDTPQKNEDNELICYECDKFGSSDGEEMHPIYDDDSYAYENDKNSEEWDEWDLYNFKRGG